MAWIDRLIDQIPDSPDSVGAWLVVGGSIGMITAMLLQDFPLSVGSTLLFLAGTFGPAFHDLKQRRDARRAVIPAHEERCEDAKVDAYVLATKRDAAFVGALESGTSEERPLRHRLH
jgi:pimeloyl-ACP methyl ester carboxylesterase